MWKHRQRDRRTAAQRGTSGFDRRLGVEHRIAEFNAMPFERVEPGEYKAIAAAFDDSAVKRREA